MDTITVTPVRAGNDETYYQCWYPVCLGSEIGAETLAGVDILGTRVIVYHDLAAKVVVQSAWCPHLGADLSQGVRIEGQVRCPYHHWHFDSTGACKHIPAGDRIPAARRRKWRTRHACQCPVRTEHPDELRGLWPGCEALYLAALAAHAA